MKKKEIHYLKNYSDVKILLEESDADHLSYILKYSGYSLKLIVENNVYLFCDALSRTNFFSVLNKIKKEITDTAVIFDDAMDKINYYNHSLKKFKGRSHYDRIYNIDIKKAYAKTLLNELLITAQTYKYLDKLNKMDRLKVVGSLATQTILVEKENGVMKKGFPKIIEDENLRRCFFHVSNIIGEIMNMCAKIAGEDFIFFWVDGIFLRSDYKKFEILSYLSSLNYDASCEWLTDFNIESKSGYNNITFFDEDKNFKEFNLPNNTENNFKKLNQWLKN